MMFFLLRKLGFNDFAKLTACVVKMMDLSVVFTQILDHCAEDSIFCDAHKCWIVSGFAIKTEL
jgi:hypothetical protein